MLQSGKLVWMGAVKNLVNKPILYMFTRPLPVILNRSEAICVPSYYCFCWELGQWRPKHCDECGHDHGNLEQNQRRTVVLKVIRIEGKHIIALNWARKKESEKDSCTEGKQDWRHNIIAPNVSTTVGNQRGTDALNVRRMEGMTLLPRIWAWQRDRGPDREEQLYWR